MLLYKTKYILVIFCGFNIGHGEVGSLCSLGYECCLAFGSARFLAVLPYQNLKREIVSKCIIREHDRSSRSCT